ncbi:hypothetical protein ABW48_03630 [Pluralibacter gergoviae]|nr:hypothetical protein ABW48_03630 [Pluralibacter gergoviae]
MAEIDFDNGSFLRDYYPLSKAVKIISEKIEGFDIDDLLHLGATSTIPISYHIPEMNTLDAFLELDEEKFLAGVLDKINMGEDVEEVRIDSFTSLFSLSRHQFNNEEDIGPFKVQLKSDEYVGLVRSQISGVWDISSWGAELFERYGEATVSDLGWLYPSTLSEDDSFIAIIAHGSRRVKLSDLVITADTMNGIRGSAKRERTQKASPNIFDGAHTREYHAAKREAVLKAAIYMKENYPNLCLNNTKWAEAIHDHAYKFWPEGEPPLTIKSISELLGKALSCK